MSQDGGVEPVWAPSGRELFFRSGNRFVAARVQTAGTFSVLSREVLFEYPGTPFRLHTNYDVHPDGDRFVMVGVGEQPTELVVVLNWVEELRRQVR